jgi:transcriptional regulator with XRE-family HTH domain
MIDSNTLGNRIKELRMARGWTQGILSEHAKVSQGEVCKIEKGHVNGLKSETITKLADALEVRPETLTHGTVFSSLFGQSSLLTGAEFGEAPTIVAYFASALTGLTAEQMAEIAELDERVDQVFRGYSAYPSALYRPRKKTSPTDNPDISAREVYEIDQERVASADLVILATVFPSLGAGMELQLALQAGTTVVLLRKQGLKLSRMVLGCPAAIETIEYHDLDNLENKLVKLLDELMPSLAKFRFLHTDASDSGHFELGERISFLRRERHLQPGDLARMVGVNIAYIESLESKSERITNPSLRILRRIARTLLTTETYLISGHQPLDSRFQSHYETLQTYANKIKMPVPDFNAIWSEHYEEYKYDLAISGVANRAEVGDRKYWMDRYERFQRAKANGNLFGTANS